MPSYEIDIPGSGTYRIDSPSELSDDQAYRMAAGRADMLRMANPTAGMSTGDKLAAGAGKAVSDLWQGAKQIVGASDTKDVAETRGRDAALMDTTAGKIGNFGGSVAMAVPTMFVPGINTYTGAALLGAGQGLLQPTGEGESRGVNTAVGGVSGLFGQGVGNMIGRAIRPVQSTLNGEEARLAAEAAQRGIPLSPGQATGSRPLQVAESVLENLPFTSAPQLAQKQAQQTAFNRAVGSTFGSTDEAITPQVLGQARTRIGQRFTDLASRNTLQADNALMTSLSQVDDNARRYLTPDVGHVVLNRIDDVLARIDNGQMSGTAYRNLDSELGRAMRGTSNGDLRNAVGDLRGALREAMDRSISGADQAAWRDARREYASLMTVAPLAAKSETGDISGRTLLNAANAGNKSAKFGAPSELAELGRIGRAFVADNIPNSGTAQRQLIQSLLTGGGGAGIGAVGAAATGNDPLKGAGIGLGVTGAGLLTPRLMQAMMNSEAGRAYLTRGLLQLGPEELAGINAIARPAGSAGLLGYTQQK
jgi:hypothetical protein